MLDGLQIAPVIEAGRLTLRPPRTRDAGLMGHYLSDARVARSLISIPHPFPPGAAEAMIERALDGRRSGPLLVMDATPSDGPGLVGLVFLNGDESGEEGVFRLAYMVGPPFWNTGYASQAVQAVCGAVFDAGARAITASVFQDNDVPAHVLTRAGFAYEGEAEAYCAARGAVTPCWRYRLEAGSWTASD